MSLNTPQIQKLWSDAQKWPEWATTKFWEYIFNQNAFADHQWIVSSQQPPTYDQGDLRRVDLVVEQIDDNANSANLLFMEAKRANATSGDIEQVEYQAFTACCANLYSTPKPAIWAMTCVGSRTRIWTYKYGTDYLTPFFPRGDALSEISEYIEFSAQGSDIVASLETIKKHPVPPDHIFDRSSSPRPAHAALPSGWHDAEVGYITTASSRYEDPAASEMPSEQPSGNTLAEQPEELWGVINTNTSMGPPLKGEECKALEVVKRGEDGKLRCVDSSDRFLMTEAGKWKTYYVFESGQRYEGFSYMGKSGTQYYTWTLEPKGKRKK